MYRITGENEKKPREARILACRTADDRVEIPGKLDGYPVTEIASYGFSARRANREIGIWSTGRESRLNEQELPPLLCGDRLVSIGLPPSIRSVGSYAFYNCDRLEEISCSSTVSDLGAGLFTGCGRVTLLNIAVDEKKRSCLKEVLAELRQTLTVRYLCDRGEARLVFPEFYEESVENTPARILFTKTHGCGHRYRYCFDRTQFLFSEYDRCFPHMRAQEQEELTVRLALARMQYPMELTRQAGEAYREYIKEHWSCAGREILSRKHTGELDWLINTFEADREQTDRLVELAGDIGACDASSCLMDYRHRHWKNRKRRFEL